jgi:ankyrin repeat protein
MSPQDFYIKFKYISDNNDLSKLNLLIETEEYKNILMSYSALFYNLNFIKHLVDKGFDIHCENDYVFSLSCSHNKPDITRYFLSTVADNNYPDLQYYINIALIQYAHSGDIEFVNEMIDMGGKVTYSNNEAIIWAAGYGKLEMVKYLIYKGADIYARNDMALSVAKQNHHKEMIVYLKSLGLTN